MLFRTELSCLLLMACSMGTTAVAAAAWLEDPTVNTPLCIGASDQGGSGVPLAGDGAGGAIAVWADTRNGVTDIYAQRVDAGGVMMWTINGVAVCTADNKQESPMLVATGDGGALISWDGRLGVHWSAAQTEGLDRNVPQSQYAHHSLLGRDSRIAHGLSA